MTEDHGDLRDAIADLRGDLREAVATLRGSIDTLAAVKSGEVDQLSKEVSAVRHNHAATVISVGRLHDRLDAYPDPDRLQDTMDGIEDKLDGLATHAEVSELAAKLDGYPKAEAIKASMEQTAANQLSIIKLMAIAVGGGFAGQLLGSVGLF